MAAKRGRGRPRLPPQEVRTVVLQVRLSEQEAALVREMAERDKAASVSEWVRDSLVALAQK